MIQGRPNPIRDNLDRTYLYASNIAMDQGKQQPVYFALGKDLRLTDAHDQETIARIVDVVGKSTGLEYHPPSLIGTAIR